ncbi:unnamed protein product [Candidula unifasciata]|uniref:Hexosyltransferase n=1 Tax=Candidula unifasciata TaxID=100452 RepID=A0A8S3ZUN7_9EUPU|nr:unnamed protein product [Candidula unifasciata]
MNNIENAILKPKADARLVLVLYKAKGDSLDHKLTLDLVQHLQLKYGREYIEVVQTNSEFSRGPALQLGAEHCSPEALLFFIDVDIIFTAASLERVRLNTLRGSQVYFPIVFSQYDPQPVCLPGSPHCVCQDSECILKEGDVSDDAGYWRQFGFGIAAMYRSDYHKVGGFDLSIRGWENNFVVFRAVDPGMTHIFHTIQCSESLESSQLTMCVNSKAQSYASTSLLASQIYSNPDILHRLEGHGQSDES